MSIIRWLPTAFDRASTPWRRQVESKIQEHENFIARQGTEGDNLSKSIASGAKRMALTIKSLPFFASSHESVTGFGLSSGWNTITTVQIPHPAGWSLLSITAIGTAAAVDTLSGGLTICEGRIVIGAVESPTFAPAKDAGASAVNNILTLNFGQNEVDTSLADFTECKLDMRPQNPSAFPSRPSNYANLTVNAVFTNPSPTQG